MSRRLLSSFKPIDPNYKERIRESFAKQSFMNHLGATISHIAPGEVDLTATNQPTLKQQHNFFHMGVTTTLADTAAGYAAYSLFPENTDVLTTGI
jgi:acyl-coenzyme A thioesterase PaaI-like protein